jgi:hypothetical protein
MKKQLIIVLIGLLLVVVGLSGCLSQDENKAMSNPDMFVGKWIRQEPPISEEYNFTLFANGTCDRMPWHSFSGTWGVEDNLLIFTAVVDNTIYTYRYDYSFTNNSKTLSLNALDFPTASTLVFIKQ